MNNAIHESALRTAARHLVRAERKRAFAPSPVVRGLARVEYSYWRWQWRRAAAAYVLDPPDPGPDDGTGLGDRDSEGDEA